MLVAKVAGRLRTSERRRSAWRENLSDIELGLLLLTATYVFLAALGGVPRPVFPLVYALVSFLVTFHRLAVGLPLALAAIALEAVMAFGPGAGPGAAAVFPGHVVFIVIFAVLNVAFLHAEVARQRREHRRRLETEVASMREEARDFRLISTALPSESRVRTRAEEEEKLSQGSIETIHQQLFATLDLLRKSLGLQTCALLWLDAAGEKLKLKEVASDGPALAEGPFPARTGVFGAILKERKPLHLEAPRPQLLPYYDGPGRGRRLPGRAGGRGARPLRGHPGGRSPRRAPPSTRRELELCASAAAQVMRIVQSERVFQAVERSQARARALLQGVGGAEPGADPGRGLRRRHRGGARGVRVRLRRHRHPRRRATAATPCAGWWARGRRRSTAAASATRPRWRRWWSKNKLALPAAGEWGDRDDVARVRSQRALRRFPVAAGAAPAGQGRGDRAPSRWRRGGRARSPPTGARCWA